MAWSIAASRLLAGDDIARHRGIELAHVLLYSEANMRVRLGLILVSYLLIMFLHHPVRPLRTGPQRNLEMRTSLAFREVPVERRRRIRWDELGRPIEPCFREYQGELIEVRQKDIEAAQDNPNAVFSAQRFRPWTGPEYYRLGCLQIVNGLPEPAVTPADANANPRRLRIKWSDLGVLSKPGTVEHRGLIIYVQAKDIEAAGGNPEALFTATQIRPHTGHPYYVLGRLEI